MPTSKKRAAKSPSKPEASMSKSELTAIRRMLEERRDRILETMKKNQDMAGIQDVGDEADQAGQSIEKEILFELSDNERTQLDQVEGALRKMDKGTYGLCESCQKPIPKLRIKAVPFARYCLACQSSAERAMVS